MTVSAGLVLGATSGVGSVAGKPHNQEAINRKNNQEKSPAGRSTADEGLWVKCSAFSVNDLPPTFFVLPLSLLAPTGAPVNSVISLYNGEDITQQEVLSCDIQWHHMKQIEVEDEAECVI